MDGVRIYSTNCSWEEAAWFCDLLQKEGCWWVYLKPSACSLNLERQKHQLVPKSSIMLVVMPGCCTAVWHFLGKAIQVGPAMAVRALSRLSQKLFRLPAKPLLPSQAQLPLQPPLFLTQLQRWHPRAVSPSLLYVRWCTLSGLLARCASPSPALLRQDHR